MMTDFIQDRTIKLMKNVLFENVGGNRFRLLKEATNVNESLISSGLKKVFSTSDDAISYQRVEAVGLSYIKDITEAKRVALDEAKSIAKSFGYKDVVSEARFVKEEHEETDMNNSEERQEVQIAKQILQIIESDLKFDLHPSHEAAVQKIKGLAEQLIKMHGQQ